MTQRTVLTIAASLLLASTLARPVFAQASGQTVGDIEIRTKTEIIGIQPTEIYIPNPFGGMTIIIPTALEPDQVVTPQSTHRVYFKNTGTTGAIIFPRLTWTGSLNAALEVSNESGINPLGFNFGTGYAGGIDLLVDPPASEPLGSGEERVMKSTALALASYSPPASVTAPGSTTTYLITISALTSATGKVGEQSAAHQDSKGVKAFWKKRTE